MYLAKGQAYREHEDLVMAADKRGQRLKFAERAGECLPIGELGSKAVYEVSAERFRAFTLDR